MTPEQIIYNQIIDNRRLSFPRPRFLSKGYKLIPLNQKFGETQRLEEEKRKLDEELEKELETPNLPPYTEKRWEKNHH